MRGGNGDASVACEILDSDVIFIDAKTAHDGMQAGHHLWRTRDVVNGVRMSGRAPGMSQDHSRIDPAGLAGPWCARVMDPRHRRDECKTTILPLESVQLIQKRRVLGTPVGVEEQDAVRQLLVRRPPDEAPERSDADAARE